MDGTIFRLRGTGTWLTSLLARCVELMSRYPYDPTELVWTPGIDDDNNDRPGQGLIPSPDRHRHLAPAGPAVEESLEFVNGR